MTSSSFGHPSGPGYGNGEYCAIYDFPPGPLSVAEGDWKIEPDPYCQFDALTIMIDGLEQVFCGDQDGDAPNGVVPDAGSAIHWTADDGWNGNRVRLRNDQLTAELVRRGRRERV